MAWLTQPLTSFPKKTPVLKPRAHKMARTAMQSARSPPICGKRDGCGVGSRVLLPSRAREHRLPCAGSEDWPGEEWPLWLERRNPEPWLEMHPLGSPLLILGHEIQHQVSHLSLLSPAPGVYCPVSVPASLSRAEFPTQCRLAPAFLRKRTALPPTSREQTPHKSLGLRPLTPKQPCRPSPGRKAVTP